VLTMVRFGAFEQILKLVGRPKEDIDAGVWDFGQGYAHLRRGDVDAAREELKRVQKGAETSKQSFRVYTAHNLLGTLAGILEGEIERSAGNLPAAIGAFERAVERQDATTYDEPEALPFDARHWLGAALL